MNSTMELFINKHWIKRLDLPTIEETASIEVRRQKLSDAGFNSQARLLEKQISVAKKNVEIREVSEKINKENRILLQTPNFRTIEIKTYSKSTKTAIIGAVFASLILGFTITSLLEFTVEASFIHRFGVSALLSGVFGLLLGGFIFMELIWLDADDNVTKHRYTACRVGFNKYLVEASPSDYLGAVPEQVLDRVIESKSIGRKTYIWTIANRSNIGSIVHGEKVIKIDPLLIRYIDGLPNHVELLAIWGEDIEDLETIFPK